MMFAELSGREGAFSSSRVRSREVSSIILLLGVASLVLPTLLSLAREHWSTESGAHGPLILVSGLWLWWRDRTAFELRAGCVHDAWLLLLAPLAVLYAYGRAFGLLGTETAALYAILVLLGFYYIGPTSMRRMWFAVAYLGFLVTPPYGLIAELTQPLKIAISTMVVDLLYALGYPIAQSGVLIQVGQYELLVQQACAGLASLVTLLAMGLLYVHLTKPAGRAQAVMLLLAIVPIALLANFLRVTLLVLLTYHVSDAFAQSAAHDAAGLITFSFAMLGMIGFDRLLDRLLRKERAS